MALPKTTVSSTLHSPLKRFCSTKYVKVYIILIFKKHVCGYVMSTLALDLASTNPKNKTDQQQERLKIYTFHIHACDTFKQRSKKEKGNEEHQNPAT